MDFFLYLDPSGKAKFYLLLLDVREMLLDWHCTLSEVLDLTPPSADDLALFIFLCAHLADAFYMPKFLWIIV